MTRIIICFESDSEFFEFKNMTDEEALTFGELKKQSYTTQEFEDMFNNDIINQNTCYIRIINLETI